jgi:hypothetical protein
MGKKRRLNSAKTKFKTKHANHPRVQYLNNQEEETIEEAIVKTEPTPKVALQEKKVEVKPKAAPKPKTTKKPRRTSRKKTTKKVTPTAS